MSLFPISELIANSALNLGGSIIEFHKATFCTATRQDGSPCFDERTGSSWVECQQCRGRGHYYAKPVRFKGIYTDNSNQITYNAEGVALIGEKTLSIPAWVPTTLLKPRVASNGAGTHRVMRDKFILLSPSGQIVDILFLKHESVNPTINSGTIYKIINVENNV